MAKRRKGKEWVIWLGGSKRRFDTKSQALKHKKRMRLSGAKIYSRKDTQ